MTIDFNNFQNNYEKELERAIAFSGQDVNFFTQVKANLLIKLASKYLGEISEKKIIDIGCGIGLTNKILAPHFKNLFAVDIAKDLIEKAKSQNPTIQYFHYDGHVLPFPDGKFDLAFTICVMHCLPVHEWTHYIKEISRTVKKGGFLVVFEHNPLNPLTRYVVNRCSLSVGANLVLPSKLKKTFLDCELTPIEKKYFLIFPWEFKWLKNFEKLVSFIPFGAQYFMVGKK